MLREPRIDDFSIERLDLSVFPEEFFCLVGPSGSGKSTILGLMGGWLLPDVGSITISGANVTSLGPNQRPIRACFQKGGYLFPHMSVGENVGYALSLRGCPKNEISSSVNAVLRDVGLGGFEGRFVDSLSGGEVQRVSIARALADPQPILLLDEITAGLDRPLRAAILGMIESLLASRRLTAVCVTHDVEEAFRLCNRFNSRLGVLNAGKLEQVGSPQTIYSEPVSSFVASLVGDVNLLSIVKQDESGVVVEGGFSITPLENIPPSARWLAIRPEDIYLQKPIENAFVELPASVEYVDATGPVGRVQVRANGIVFSIMLTQTSVLPRAGQGCPIFLNLAKVRLFER
jgi:ABC-type Fe3+/spermidine/putrescine transport system ATPase subunit